MDESRTRTLRALIAVAEQSAPSSCWDDTRAADLLRAQFKPADLEEAGASRGLIEWLWPETHER